jgi:hypothetical protein
MKRHYEVDDATFNADAYRVRGYSGIAFCVQGWETVPDEDTEWSGFETRTGRVLAVMIGDDRQHCVDVEDLTALPREEYCGSCGQIGCRHDGLDREDSE